MCGRFVASRRIEEVVDAFGVQDVEVPAELLEPRWNVAPQTPILAVTARRATAESAVGASSLKIGASSLEIDGSGPEPLLRRRLSAYRWGLVPPWAKDPSFGVHAFNARAESIDEKPAFRTAVAKHRCLIPADAFYEWRREPSGEPKSSAKRQPWCFRPVDGGLIAFAGLWQAWRRRGDELGEWLLTCTIITTDANRTVAQVHSRMPVVLEPEAWGKWLSPAPLAPVELHSLLQPAREGLLRGYPVDPLVNDARIEGPQLWQSQVAEEPTRFDAD